MKFNLLEKKALIGTFIISLLFIICVIIIGKRNMWFEAKNHYYTIVRDADGLREGSIVTMSGLRVGQVEQMLVSQKEGVIVKFSLKKSLSYKIKKGTKIYLFRAFIIGEKRIDISPGKGAELIKNGEKIEGIDSLEIADLISGKKMATFTSQLGALSQSIGKWGEIFTELTKRVKVDDLANTYELIHPTLFNIRALTKELITITAPIAQKKHLVTKLLKNGAKLSKDFSTLISPISKRTKLIEQLLDNINIMSSEITKNPSFTKNMINALKEVTITLKALQKTWLLEDHVNAVKKK